MLKEFMDVLIGQPLPNEKSSSEKFNVPFGLAIMASDAVSSVAYAGEEILRVLIPVIGVASYAWLGFTSALIIGLLAILTFSYMQVIKAYPQGGGAYIVAKENIGTTAGLFAGAALSTDYVMTVAVSACAGIEAVVSAFPSLHQHKVALIVLVILILTILNLRGISESSRIFSVPTYIFIFSMIGMIIYGFVKYFFILHGHVPPLVMNGEHLVVNKTTGVVTVFLILKAFSQGCSALTGVEAVSNSVPNFKEPSQKHATIVLALLSILILFIFGGTALLSNYYHAIPHNQNPTVIAQIAYSVFGKGFMFYLLQFSTAVILMMACNTAFTGFPMLMYVVGKDGFAPRQFTIRGQRLSFSTGITVLSAVACVIVIVFRGDTSLLIPLYSVGVFVSFTLSQTGMVIHWKKSQEQGWKWRCAVNGFGAVVTVIATLIIASVKFFEGAWIIIFLIPILVKLMLTVKKHYNQVAENLRASDTEMQELDDYVQFTHHIIIPVASLNKAALLAMQYARSLTPNVIVLHIGTDLESIEKLKVKWAKLDTDIMLVTKYSKFRTVITPLIKYIDDISRAAGPNEKVTVILPQFVTKSFFSKLLHNHTSFFIRESMLNNENVTVATFPYQFKKEKNK